MVQVKTFKTRRGAKPHPTGPTDLEFQNDAEPSSPLWPLQHLSLAASKPHTRKAVSESPRAWQRRRLLARLASYSQIIHGCPEGPWAAQGPSSTRALIAPASPGSKAPHPPGSDLPAPAKLGCAWSKDGDGGVSAASLPYLHLLLGGPRGQLDQGAPLDPAGRLGRLGLVDLSHPKEERGSLVKGGSIHQRNHLPPAHPLPRPQRGPETAPGEGPSPSPWFSAGLCVQPWISISRASLRLMRAHPRKSCSSTDGEMEAWVTSHKARMATWSTSFHRPIQASGQGGRSASPSPFRGTALFSANTLPRGLHARAHLHTPLLPLLVVLVHFPQTAPWIISTILTTCFYVLQPQRIAACCVISVFRPGIEPGPQWRGHRILTTGPPGNSLSFPVLPAITSPCEQLELSHPSHESLFPAEPGPSTAGGHRWDRERPLLDLTRAGPLSGPLSSFPAAQATSLIPFSLIETLPQLRQKTPG